MNRYHNDRACVRTGSEGRAPCCAGSVRGNNIQPVRVPGGGISAPSGGCGGVPERRGMPLAIAYVKDQDFNGLYSCGEALCRGTLFKDLDKPFLQGRRAE